MGVDPLPKEAVITAEIMEYYSERQFRKKIRDGDERCFIRGRSGVCAPEACDLIDRLLAGIG